MTIKEIDTQIEELKKQREKLEREERKAFLEKAKENVGRCFRLYDRYVKVIDVPQEEFRLMGGSIFNEYQYPAIYLGNNIVPFEEGTIHSGEWIKNNGFNHKYEEISLEEFEKEFNKKLAKFVARVGVNLNKL